LQAGGHRFESDILHTSPWPSPKGEGKKERGKKGEIEEEYLKAVIQVG